MPHCYRFTGTVCMAGQGSAGQHRVRWVSEVAPQEQASEQRWRGGGKVKKETKDKHRILLFMLVPACAMQDNYNNYT